MKKIAFFNNKGGVGKTSIIYHLAHMFADKGIETIAVDLDPQANLTSAFLDADRLQDLWDEKQHTNTIYGAISPIMNGTGDARPSKAERITETLHLIPGDLRLSLFEDKLSDAWPRCHNQDAAAFRVMTAFHRIIEMSAEESVLALVDIGPNLGAINRAALIACDYVIVPLAPDLFSLQGLKNLGPTLKGWRKTWQDLTPKAPADISIPNGDIEPLGYIVMRHSILNSKPVKAYQRWIEQIPAIYRDAILEQNPTESPKSPEEDDYCLAILKDYRSLMPLSMESHKPMFFLKPADGAIGAHVEAVRSCYEDFSALAQRIGQQISIASL